VNNDTLFIVAIVAVVATVGFATTLQFVRRLMELRHERQPRTPPDGFDALARRLDRIENAVETTALEVERIAEANRFMAKLLAERGTPPPPPLKPERVITPH
jgi:hypothetical protein